MPCVWISYEVVKCAHTRLVVGATCGTCAASACLEIGWHGRAGNVQAFAREKGASTPFTPLDNQTLAPGLLTPETLATPYFDPKAVPRGMGQPQLHPHRLSKEAHQVSCTAKYPRLSCWDMTLVVPDLMMGAWVSQGRLSPSLVLRFTALLCWQAELLANLQDNAASGGQTGGESPLELAAPASSTGLPDTPDLFTRGNRRPLSASTTDTATPQPAEGPTPAGDLPICHR